MTKYRSEPTEPLSMAELVALLALMMSTVAMAIDIMLPALGVIAQDFGLATRNDAQLVISCFFLGFAIGQIFVGPLSDSFGRKRVIYAGYLIFVAGCLLSMLTESWTLMLAGRVLAGLGAAAPRVVTVAIVRDGYEGRAMARIMSIVIAVFIVVPVIAPLVGQVVLIFAGWWATFACLIALAGAAAIWLIFRQPETLAPAARRPFRIRTIASGMREVCSSRIAVGYTIAAGLIAGPFLGYLNAAPQIFQTTFEVGHWFPAYFGGAALSIGVASVFNSRIVVQVGMYRLVVGALICVTTLSLVFLASVTVIDRFPPLTLFLAWLVAVFFCIGLLFGNLNALAMEPLGHLAGLGAAFVGSMSTFISLVLGWFIGSQYDGSVFSLVLGFAALGAASLLVVWWTERGRDALVAPQTETNAG